MMTPNHEPTPEEIRAMCELIRAEWSPAEERKRRVIGNPDAETRVVNAEISAIGNRLN